MKLHRNIVNEMQGPVSYGLTLDEIIRDGKVTNPYQLLTLARLSEFFKSGLKSTSLQSELPTDFGTAATSTEVMDSLKAMSPQDHVELAEFLKACIAAGEAEAHEGNLNVIEWQKYVLSKQR
jgi:hypothetical protein